MAVLLQQRQAQPIALGKEYSMFEAFDRWVKKWEEYLRFFDLTYDEFPSNRQIFDECPFVITDEEKASASARFDAAKAARSDEYWNVS